MTDPVDPTDVPPAASLATRTRTESVAERQARGRAARENRSRTSIARFVPSPDRPSPVDLLAGQETVRVQALLPLRHTRMAVSPFTFYRGSAVVMTDDLAAQPNSGLIVQLCGDAHLSNFGMFAAPDRQVVFDINDFDETNPGPFEWDVLRLATSFVLAGRDVKLDEAGVHNAAAAVGFAYRSQMATYAGMTDLDIWYDRISVETLQQWARQLGSDSADKRVEKSASKARSRDMWSAIAKMTELVDGHRRFKSLPPLLMPIPLNDEASAIITGLLEEYQLTMPADRAQLLRRYRVIDFAHKVVGVGSVGLLAFVVLLEGRDQDDLLVLQVKQAVPSVLEAWTAPSVFPVGGQRVVVGQQIMQAASDAFLGWLSGPRGRQFYVRQLRDMKFSVDPANFTDSLLLGYAVVCGRALARAHARAGDSVAIAAYLGTSAKFDNAVRDFACAYADQVALDYAAYTAAIAGGSVAVTRPGEGENYKIVADPARGVSVEVDLGWSSTGVPPSS